MWMLDMGLAPIAGDFQALSEDEYKDIMMEAEEEEMMAANVVEISDGNSSEEAAMEVDDEDGGDNVQMVLYGANEAGMGQSG